MRRRLEAIGLLTALIALTACSTPAPPAPSGHLPPTETGRSPHPLSSTQTPALPFVQPEATPAGQSLYSVVVEQVAVQELLFALARDADIDIDLAGPFEGQVTLNAVDEPLPRILDRIALQVPIRYSFTAGHLLVEADRPYPRLYQIPYLNMGRRSVSRVDLATQIGSTGMSASGGGDASNNSRTRIENTADNLFWDSLIANIEGMLRNQGTDPAAGGLIVNREAGVISIQATQRRHREFAEYIDAILASARRQVLIEATVVEVRLNDGHQAGVDWSVLSADGEGISLVSQMLGTSLSAAPAFGLDYTDSDNNAGIVNLTLRALSSFGDVQVLSSPKIIALNNQTAILKVVDNRVYFTTSVTITEGNSTTPPRETFDTELHTVPIGLVMNVTPFVSADSEIVLNVRPTISRILGFVNDPNPDLASAGVASQIPEIQVREMESLLRVGSGQIAVIGGLMQDRQEQTHSAIPWLSSLPLIGRLFSYRAYESVKTELLVFLRPTVIETADVGADLSEFREYLPHDQ